MSGAMLRSLGLLALLSTPGSLERPAIELQWIALASCPSQTEVIAETGAWLRLAKDPGAAVTARATVIPGDEGLLLLLQIDTPDGALEQSTTSPDCGPLAEATALQVAMAIDPEAVAAEFIARSQAAQVETTAVAKPTVTETPTSEPIPEAPPPAPVGPRGAAWFEGSLGGGRVPRLDGRIGVGGSLLLPLVRVDLGVAYTMAQRRAHPSIGGLALDLWQWGIVARGCGRPWLGPIELPVCGGAEVGATVGRGDGVQQQRTARAAWLAGLVSVGVSWSPWRWAAIGVAGEGYAAITRSPFTVDVLDPFFVPTVVGGAALLRVEGRFP